MVNFIVRFCGFMAMIYREIGGYVAVGSLLSFAGALLSGEILMLRLTDTIPEFVYYAGIANLLVAPPAFALVVPVSVFFVATCTSLVAALPASKIRIY